ncbi:MAG: HAMP domain-containing sensor histidine kinase [Archangium sp.]|nr:HAMP domain-containing sensor histidine kinase [Archangium sp.]
MKPEGVESLSLEEVEEAALETLFQKGVQLRLYFAPFVFLAVMSLLAWDPAPWRLWVVVFGVTLALARLSFEFLRVRRDGFQRTRLSTLLPVPATLLLLVVSSSGGLDSPIFVMLPLVTVFLCLFLRPVYGLIFSIVSTVLVWMLAVVAWNEWVPTLIPAVFGGGPRVPGTAVLLFTRATFHTLALLWAALVGWVMRRGFQAAIQRALDARDELLVSHEESTRTLTTLAAEIAHELKNPLASVKGLAALVDRDAQGKEKERLTVLRREVDRMQEILESFLNFSRPLVPLDVAPVRLAEVVEQVAALHEGVARERGVTVRLDARPDVTVKADGRKLKQVIINLMQNALDVTPSGGAVDVVVGPDGGGAKVSVMDRGPGVKDPERVFDPGVTSKENGNGLGLTISRLLARQHGGDVRLSARDGGGTIALLTLPGAPPP